MGVLPYLPSGLSELPAERFLLFADSSHKVQRIDESVLTKDGSAFTAYWVSPRMGKGRIGQITLSGLYLYYAAISSATLIVGASGNGGETWTSQNVSLSSTTERIGTKFVGIGVTGSDVRFKLTLPSTPLVSIFGYVPAIIDRGDLIL